MKIVGTKVSADSLKKIHVAIARDRARRPNSSNSLTDRKSLFAIRKGLMRSYFSFFFTEKSGISSE
jgi:hypothetical protein